MSIFVGTLEAEMVRLFYEILILLQNISAIMPHCPRHIKGFGGGEGKQVYPLK